MFPLLTVALAATLVAVDPRTLIYYPTAVGTAWVVRSNRLESDATYTVTAVEEKDGAKLVTVASTYLLNPLLVVPGQVRQPIKVENLDRYRVSRAGLTHVEAYDRDAKKWVKVENELVEWPGKPGTRGTYKQPNSNYEMKWIVGKPEKVTVAAGTFDAVPVRRDWVRGEYMGKDTFWYVAGIGVIKSTIDGEPGAELISFTPPKK